MNIGKEIKKIRESKGLTKYQLSKEVGISQTNITRLENENKGTFCNLYKIMKVLNINIEFYENK